MTIRDEIRIGIPHEAASLRTEAGHSAIVFFRISYIVFPIYLLQLKSLKMPPKKAVPYREGYKLETRFPKKGSILLTPIHGAGPRCRVDYSPDDDGLWAMLQIMRIDDNQIEHYTCTMPHYYAVPLILMNKRIAYFEAQCAPDGTPFPAEDGTVGLKLRDIKEYTYLWRLRCRFLQAVFDMNHERKLDETWRCNKIHGFMHRTYKRYGHDAYQRHAYWRDEIEAGRMPYAAPAIADMGTLCRPSSFPSRPLAPPPPASIMRSGVRRLTGSCKKTGKPSLLRKWRPAPASTRSCGTASARGTAASFRMTRHSRIGRRGAGVAVAEA